MAQRRRFGDSLLFRQFAKSAYYFTPLPGTGCVPPLLERDGCVSRNCVRSWEREKSRATGAQAKAKAALNKLINYPARGQRGEEGKTGEY